MDQPPTFASPINVSSLINNPPASEAETPPIKRKRLTQACDACRKKKVKCSGEKPTCNNCSRLGTTCTYLPSTRKRGPRVGLVESLEKRLQQMEKLLQPLKEQGLVDEFDDKPASYSAKKPRLNSNSNDDVSYSSFGVDTTTPVQNNSVNYMKSTFISPSVQNIESQFQTSNVQRVMDQEINNDNSHKDEQASNDSGKEDDTLIYFGKTSLRPGFIHRSELNCNKFSTVPESPTISDGSSSSGSNSDETPPIIHSPIPKNILASDLIPPDVIEHLASCFFRYIEIQFSMFHEATFMRQLRQKKVPSLLILAMCAVSSRFATHPSFTQYKYPFRAGDHFEEVANRLILPSFDTPSVENVQAFILLALHMFGTCKAPRFWMYVGMAVRMAQEIGLHKIDEAPVGQQTNAKSDKSAEDFIQKETRRRTFWACFLLDRYTSCAVGRPTLIEEDDCDVRLPCNEAIWNYDHPFSKSLIEEYYNQTHVKLGPRLTLTKNGLCACFVSVAALLGRVTQFVNRTKPPNALPPWDPQSEFSILSNEIEEWYNSLNPHYSYSKERLQKLMTNGTGIVFSSIHLFYWATIIVLNRPNIAILQHNEVDRLHNEFMLESAKRCSHAAKMAVLISSDILQNGSHCFSPYSVYPLYVSTTILINDTYSSNISVAEEAKKNLVAIEKYLNAMSPYWAMGGKFLCIINKMREMRDEQFEKFGEKSGETFRNLNPDQTNEMSTGTDAGLLAYWNRTNTTVATETNLGSIPSIIYPEEFVSPRWLGSINDIPISNDTWTNFLRSPQPFTPRTLSRFLRKDKNSNAENSDENDYFSQDTAMTYNTPIFDGYPMVDMPSLLPQTNNNNATLDWLQNKDLLLNRPFRHWSSINGNTGLNEEANNTQSASNATK